MAAPLKPASQRRTRHKPLREWQPAPGVGWQHGPIPAPPDGLMAPTRTAWETWFKAWFASHWTPADLPGLGVLIRQFDVIERGHAKANDITATVRLMDNYGITPAGQQSRRWEAPKADETAKAAPVQGGRYAHLRSVG